MVSATGTLSETIQILASPTSSSWTMRRRQRTRKKRKERTVPKLLELCGRPVPSTWSGDLTPCSELCLTSKQPDLGLESTNGRDLRLPADLQQMANLQRRSFIRSKRIKRVTHRHPLLQAQKVPAARTKASIRRLVQVEMVSTAAMRAWMIMLAKPSCDPSNESSKN